MMKELSLKVIEQFKDLVSWLKEIRFKGQLGTKKAFLRFREEEREIWQTPWEVTLERLAKVITWVLGWEIEKNNETLPNIWLEASKPIIHELWHSKVWEM